MEPKDIYAEALAWQQAVQLVMEGSEWPAGLRQAYYLVGALLAAHVRAQEDVPVNATFSDFYSRDAE
jgi:hypothetical protein